MRGCPGPCLGSGVFESRIDFGPLYRIYYGRDGQTLILLLTGGDSEISMQQSPSGTSTGAGSASADGMTRPFRDLVRESLAADPDFRAALRREAIHAIRSGDAETGRAMLRDYRQEDVPAEAAELAVVEPPPA